MSDLTEAAETYGAEFAVSEGVTMHALVVDAETGVVLIDTDLVGDTPAENPNAVGTYSGPGVMHGAVYHGVSVWVAPKTRVHAYEEDEPAVFVRWIDESASIATDVGAIVHTVERPLPGGGIGRFLVTVS